MNDASSEELNWTSHSLMTDAFELEEFFANQNPIIILSFTSNLRDSIRWRPLFDKIAYSWMARRQKTQARKTAFPREERFFKQTEDY